MLLFVLLLVAAAIFGVSTQAQSHHARPAKPNILKDLENLVTFGDSLTDENRLVYFIEHNDTAPPPGYIPPPRTAADAGGVIWARTVANTNNLNLYNYAVGGASCSNSVTNQYLSYIDADVPTLLEYEIPAFETDLALKNVSNGQPFISNRAPQRTVYSLWIGTNDLGEFSRDLNVPGTDLGNFTDCVFTCFDRLYALGARQFVLFNTLPSHLIPEYGPYDTNGPGRQAIDPDGTTNLTALAATIFNYDTAVNKIYSYAVPYYLHFNHRYPSASIILFDVHSLITDIFNNPRVYLSPPANVTGYYHHCKVYYTQCTDSSEPFDSFMWYDEGHPSQRTYDVIAKEFVEALRGESSYASYL